MTTTRRSATPRGTERVLDERTLNRALLARQGLLEGHAGRVPQVLDRIGGIQAQYAPAMYVGLLARMRSLERDAVTRGLERRTVVQGTLLRSTIHLVSRADYWPWVQAIRPHRQAWHLRVGRNGPDEAAWRAAAERVRRELAGGGELSRKELDAILGAELRSGVGLWVDLVRVPPSGTWERRSADRFALAEDWVGPEPESPTATAEDAAELVVRRYLQGFGPARVDDVMSWAQLPRDVVEQALERIGPRRFADEQGRLLVDLPRAPIPDPGTPAPVRFLPTWDAVLLVHARRTQVLPEEHRDKVFSIKRPHSIGTYLVDGQVAGSWRPVPGGGIETEAFEPLDAADARAVSAESDRLAAFHA